MDQKKTEQLKTEPSVVVDAFGIVRDSVIDPHGVDLSNPFVPEYGLELDKETGNTRAVVTGQVNFVEMIQSFASQCGVDAALRDVASGLRSPESLCDDGKHGGDFTRPTMVSAASDYLRAAQDSSSRADSAASDAGLDVEKLHGSDVEKYLNDLIQSRIDALAKKEGGSNQ